MKTIVLTGSPETGKSFCVYELAGWLLANGWKDKSNVLSHSCTWTNQTFQAAKQKSMQDIRQLLEKDGVNILLHAPMDEMDCVKELIDNLEALHVAEVKVDLLITTLRRYDVKQHIDTISAMKWSQGNNVLSDSEGNEIIQIPLLRVKYEWEASQVVDWYNQRAARVLQNLVIPYIHICNLRNNLWT